MINNTLIPTDQEFGAIRDRLLAQLDAQETLQSTPHPIPSRQRAPRSRRRVRITVGSIAVAVVLAIALVLTGGFGIAGGLASAQAATVLHQASASAFAASDPVVAAGQYLKFETKESASAYIGVADDHFTYSQTWTIYQPGTPTDNWVLVRATQAPSDPVGGAAARDAMNAWTPPAAQNGTWIGQNGHIAGWVSDESAIQTLPRTDAAVRAFLYNPKDQPGGSWSADQEAWSRAVQMLTFSYVPADLRGILFEAMTTIPGVTVTQNQAAIDGRTGVAIGLASAHGEGQEIIVDPTTGQYLGYREADDVTSVSVSVVDAAPTN